MQKILQTIRHLLEMIRFSHTVFALPFAILAACLAAEGSPTGWQLFWILMAMVGARSAAMTFNRIVDRRIDASNPRTAGRHLPSGTLSLPAAWVFMLVMIGLFEWAAYQLNMLAFALSPVALIVIMSYSLLKRVTMFCHFVLGLSLGLAPVGAWIAIRGSLDPLPILFGAVVASWTAGFDIIYACQDYESDLRQRLKSVPAALGVRNALRVSAVLHLCTLGFLYGILILHLQGIFFALAVVLVTILLVYEHALVKPSDLSRVNQAFFTVNGLISIMLLAAVILDIWIGSV